MKALDPPPAAVEDPKSVEIMRLWVAQGAEWVSLNPHLYRNRDFEEEWAWGVFLSDTIKHLANAIHEHSGKDHQSIVEKIRSSFEEEISKPTSDVSGGYLESERDT